MPLKPLLVRHTGPVSAQPDRRRPVHHPGRTCRLEIDGRERRHHLHGRVWQRGREPVKAEASGSSAVLETRSDTEQHPEIYEQFPRPFTLSIRHRLEGFILPKTAAIAGRGAWLWLAHDLSLSR